MRQKGWSWLGFSLPCFVAGGLPIHATANEIQSQDNSVHIVSTQKTAENKLIVSDLTFFDTIKFCFFLSTLLSSNNIRQLESIIVWRYFNVISPYVHLRHLLCSCIWYLLVSYWYPLYSYVPHIKMDLSIWNGLHHGIYDDIKLPPNPTHITFVLFDIDLNLYG